jgi:thymidine kinase
VTKPDAASAPPAAGALAPAPASEASDQAPAHLKFFYGPMDCGKSTLALQIDHNHARQGRHGLLLTRYDRSGGPLITTRVGLSHDALEIGDDTDLRTVVADAWTEQRRVDYVIVDEAGFLNTEHVDQLAELVDDWHIDVYCFGLTTDFRSQLLPGAKRLIELADEISAVHVEVLCWCGRPGRLNARVVDGIVVRSGDTVVVADTVVADTAVTNTAVTNTAVTGSVNTVRYQVLCRSHYRRGDLGPSVPAPDQLSLDV